VMFIYAFVVSLRHTQLIDFSIWSYKKSTMRKWKLTTPFLCSKLIIPSHTYKYKWPVKNWSKSCKQLWIQGNSLHNFKISSYQFQSLQ
jgi:hypothetical protein